MSLVRGVLVFGCVFVVGTYFGSNFVLILLEVGTCFCCLRFWFGVGCGSGTGVVDSAFLKYRDCLRVFEEKIDAFFLMLLAIALSTCVIIFV